jgi:hypothetical protein
MLLCEKFQARFGRCAATSALTQQPPPALILLNEAAIELAVPRRRLYDIINVLEAVEVCPQEATPLLCSLTVSTLCCFSWWSIQRGLLSRS